MRPPVSSGNKGLCQLKDSCFHLETKTFVSFDAGGAAQQMGDKVQIVRVMTHGRVTAPQMEDKVQRVC